MNKKHFWLMWCVVLAVLLLGIGIVSAENVTVVDILEREVTVDSPPALGVVAGKKTATISEAPYLFINATGHMAATIGGQDKGKFQSLLADRFEAIEDSSVEAIAALKPSVIFLKSYTREDAGLAYEETGIPVVYLSFESIEDYHKEIPMLGKIFNEEERAAEIIAYYDEIVNTVTEKTKDLSKKPKVLLLQYSESDGAYVLKVAPEGWLQTELVSMAGGDPVWLDIGLNPNSWSDVNFEQIAAWDPDVILVVNYFADPKASVQKLVSEPGWSDLRAVKEEQVYPFGKDTLSWDSASPRWGLGLLWAFKTIHPELAEDIDMEQEIVKFYQWFGLSEDVIRENLVNAYLAEPEMVN
jgi:iron complex transport system substrate-binding protein